MESRGFVQSQVDSCVWYREDMVIIFMLIVV